MPKSNTVFITGAAGFIGSHIVDEFTNKNVNVVGLDRQKIQRDRKNSSCTYYHIDLQNTNQLQTLLNKYHPSTIIHHASNLVSVELSILYPDQAYQDLRTTIQILEIAKLYGLRHFIFASSANVYGNQYRKSISESSHTCPLSPYGLTKLAIEKYIQYFSISTHIPSTIFRYFNVYGERQTNSSKAAIPTFIVNLINNTPITINGGNQIRDFIYVKDIASANYIAYVSLANGLYNVGSGKKTSIHSVIKKLLAYIPSRSLIQYKNRLTSDYSYSLADITKIYRDLKWKPTTLLTDGLLKTVNSFNNAGF